jgi:hypothetical protein
MEEIRCPRTILVKNPEGKKHFESVGMRIELTFSLHK